MSWIRIEGYGQYYKVSVMFMIRVHVTQMCFYVITFFPRNAHFRETFWGAGSSTGSGLFMIIALILVLVHLVPSLLHPSTSQNTSAPCMLPSTLVFVCVDINREHFFRESPSGGIEITDIGSCVRCHSQQSHVTWYHHHLHTVVLSYG